MEPIASFTVLRPIVVAHRCDYAVQSQFLLPLLQTRSIILPIPGGSRHPSLSKLLLHQDVDTHFVMPTLPVPGYF
jgi:hypothetical protein